MHGVNNSEDNQRQFRHVLPDDRVIIQHIEICSTGSDAARGKARTKGDIENCCGNAQQLCQEWQVVDKAQAIGQKENYEQALKQHRAKRKQQCKQQIFLAFRRKFLIVKSLQKHRCTGDKPTQEALQLEATILSK